MTAPATPPEGLGIPLTRNTPGFSVDAIYSKNDGLLYALVNGVEIPISVGGGSGNSFVQGWGVMDDASNSSGVGGKLIIPRTGNLVNVWFGIYDTTGSGVPNNVDNVGFFLQEDFGGFNNLATATLLFSQWFAGASPTPFPLATIAIPGVTLATPVRFSFNGFSGALFSNFVQAIVLLEIGP